MVTRGEGQRLWDGRHKIEKAEKESRCSKWLSFKEKNALKIISGASQIKPGYCRINAVAFQK